MATNKSFIVSDETVNCYGFRILTSGIDTKRFEKNPVMLFNHNRDDYFKPEGYTGPVGMWNNLKKNGGEMVADAVFDTEDELGAAIGGKVDRGFLRAASIGVSILAVSEDPNDMVAGQKYPTVTKCELIEISVVDIPANKNAMALYDQDGKKIELNDDNVSVALSAFSPLTPKGGTDTEQVVTDNLKNNSLNKNTMKAKILTAWAALSAFMGITHAANAEGTDTEISHEQLANLDAQLAKMDALNATVEALTADKTSLTAEVSTLSASVTEHVALVAAKDAEIAALKGEGVEPVKPVKEGAVESLNGGVKKEEIELTSVDIEARELVAKYAE